MKSPAPSPTRTRAGSSARRTRPSTTAPAATELRALSDEGALGGHLLRFPHGGLRFAVIEALHLVAAPLPQHRRLAFGLHAFGGDGHVERLAEADDARHDGTRLRTGAEGVDEGAVDLDLLDREAGEVAQARIAGAEIVHGDRYAEMVEAGEGLQDRFGV